MGWGDEISYTLKRDRKKREKKNSISGGGGGGVAVVTGIDRVNQSLERVFYMPSLDDFLWTWSCVRAFSLLVQPRNPTRTDREEGYGGKNENEAILAGWEIVAVLFRGEKDQQEQQGGRKQVGKGPR